jgi:hypothetical protein
VWESISYIDQLGNTHNTLTPQAVVDTVPVSGTINYPEGKICLDVPVTETSVVQSQYTFRLIQTYIGDSTPWWQQIQRDSLNVASQEWLQSSCGAWTVGTQHRIQLPAIIIDAVPVGNIQGYIGGCCREIELDILFHVIAETKAQRNDVLSMLLLQSDQGLCTFDCDAAALGGSLLECGGSITEDTLTYPELVTTYPWAKARIGQGFISYLNTVDCKLYEGMIHLPIKVYGCIF